jgi:hypothetical protein
MDMEWVYCETGTELFRRNPYFKVLNIYVKGTIGYTHGKCVNEGNRNTDNPTYFMFSCVF